MTDTTINFEEEQHRTDLLEWRRECMINGDMFVGPFDGICGSCSSDLVKHFKETGQAEKTGCPLCNRSFIE